MMSETCPNCGTPARTNYRFCAACGALLPASTNSSNTPLTDQSPAVYTPPADQASTSNAGQEQTPPAYAVRRWDSLADEVPSTNVSERVAEPPQGNSPLTPYSQSRDRVAPYGGQSTPGPS